MHSIILKKQWITKSSDQNQDTSSPNLFNLHWSMTYLEKKFGFHFYFSFND